MEVLLFYGGFNSNTKGIMYFINSSHDGVFPFKHNYHTEHINGK